MPTAGGADEISISIRTCDGVNPGQIDGSPYCSVIAPPRAAFSIAAILPGSAAAGAGQRITTQRSNSPAGAIVEFPTTGLTAGVDAQVTVRNGSGGTSNSVTLPNLGGTN